MSDLISRSALIEEIKSLSIFLNRKQIFSDDAKDTVLRIINEQPTAYSVDKVVEELLTLNKNYNDGINLYEEVAEIPTEEAIEIVKQDSVSDSSNDVCEWYKVNSNACKCYTHAEIYDSRVLDWCICPYCRKKIKIVGD